MRRTELEAVAELPCRPSSFVAAPRQSSGRWEQMAAGDGRVRPSHPARGCTDSTRAGVRFTLPAAAAESACRSSPLSRQKEIASPLAPIRAARLFGNNHATRRFDDHQAACRREEVCAAVSANLPVSAGRFNVDLIVRDEVERHRGRRICGGIRAGARPMGMHSAATARVAAPCSSVRTPFSRRQQRRLQPSCPVRSGL